MAPANPLQNSRASSPASRLLRDMAVFQAVKAFELFSGQQADAQRMLQHFQQMND